MLDELSRRVAWDAVDWSGAACAGGDPNMWFPDEKDRHRTRMARAKTAHCQQVCAGCQILQVCRAYAVRHEVHGFWGGLTQDERTKLRIRGRQ